MANLPNDFYDYGGHMDLAASKRKLLDSAANTKAAQMGSPSLQQGLAAFRQANPNATPADERDYMNQVQMQKMLDRNDSLLGDIGTGIGIAFGDRLPQTAASIYGLATGSQSAMDYVAQQEAEANASREGYSVDTLEAQQNIRDNQATREASYQGRDRTWGEAAGDFFSTVGDYVVNPAAAAVEAAESADSLAMMATGGGIAGAIAKKGAQTAARNKLMGMLAESGTGAAAELAATRMALQAGANAETVAAAMSNQVTKNALVKQALKQGVNKQALKAGEEAAAKAAGVFGTAYTGLSEGAGNGVQTFNEVMELDQTILDKSTDFQSFKEQNQELSGDELKREYALSKARITAAASGVAAAAIGKLSGASDSASNALLSKKTGILKNTFKSGMKEGVEEIGQSGGGQLISNLVVKQADESKDVLKDVGNAAASGLAAGFTSGAAMGAASSTVSGAKEFAANRSAAQQVKANKTTEEEAKKLADETLDAAALNKMDKPKPDARLEALVSEHSDLTNTDKGLVDVTDAMGYWASGKADYTNKDDIAKAKSYEAFLDEKALAIGQLISDPEMDPEEKEKYSTALHNILKVSGSISGKLSVAEGSAPINNLRGALKADVSEQQLTKLVQATPIQDMSDEDLAEVLRRPLGAPLQAQLEKEQLLRSTIASVQSNIASGGFSEALGREVKGIGELVKEYETAVRIGDDAAANSVVEHLGKWTSRQQSKVNGLAQAVADIEGGMSVKEAYAKLNNTVPRQLDDNSKKWTPIGFSKNAGLNGTKKLLRAAQADLSTLQDFDTAAKAISAVADNNVPEGYVQAAEGSTGSVKWTANSMAAERTIYSVAKVGDNYSVVMDNPNSSVDDKQVLTISPDGKVLDRTVKGKTTKAPASAAVDTDTLATIKNVLGVSSQQKIPQQDPASEDSPPWDEDSAGGTPPKGKAKQDPVNIEEGQSGNTPTRSKSGPAKSGNIPEYNEDDWVVKQEPPKEGKSDKQPKPTNKPKIELGVRHLVKDISSQLKELFNKDFHRNASTGNAEIINRIIDNAAKDNGKGSAGIIVFDTMEELKAYVKTHDPAVYETMSNTSVWAIYSPDSHTAYVPKEGAPNFLVEHMMHELDHAGISTKIFNDSLSVNPPQRYKELVALYDLVKSTIPTNLDTSNRLHQMLDYMFNTYTGEQGINEFITIARTSPEVRKYLEGIKVTPKRNVFQTLMSLLGKYFGAKTPKDMNAYLAAVGLAELYQDNQDVMDTAVPVKEKKASFSVDHLKKGDRVEIHSNGEISTVSFESFEKLKAGTVAMRVTGTRVVNGTTLRGPQVVTVSRAGNVLVNGKATGEKVFVSAPPIIPWFNAVKEKTSKVLGQDVTRLANNFILNSFSGSLLARDPDFLTKDVSSFKLDHPRESELSTSKSFADFKEFFTSHKDTIVETIQQSIPTGDYSSSNWVYDLLDTPKTVTIKNKSTIKVPDAVVAAVAASMYEFLTQDARGAVQADPIKIIETLQEIHGDTLELPKGLLRELRNAGSHRVSLVPKLGSSAIQAIGLVTRMEASLNARENMKNSLGMVTLSALVNSGLLVKTDIGKREVRLDKQTNTIDIGSYYAPAGVEYNNGMVVRHPDGKVKLHPSIEKAIELNKADKNLVSSLFSVEHTTDLPSTKPREDREVRSTSDNGIATKLATKLLNDKEKVPHIINPKIAALFESQGKEGFRQLIRAIAGYDVNPDAHILGIARTAVANNQYIDNTVDKIEALVESLSTEEATEFFYTYNLGSTHREYQGTSLSMQGNKIARNLFAAKDWEATFTKEADIPEDKSNAAYAFMKAVGQGLGVEEQGVPTGQYLNAVNKKLASPAIRKAIEIIKNTTGLYSPADLAAIREAVEEGGEKVHSYTALVEIAAYESTAVGQYFSTHFYIVNDGKTSALAIAATQLSSEFDPAHLNRVGIFTKAQEGNAQLSTFSDFTGVDSYYTVAQVLAPVLEAGLPGLTYFYGALTKIEESGKAVATKAARQLVKFATMTPMYGAGLYAVAAQMVHEEIMPKVLKKFNSVTTPYELFQAVEALNSLTSDKFNIHLVGEPQKNLKDNVISIGGFKVTLGDFDTTKRLEKALTNHLQQTMKEDHPEALRTLVGSTLNNASRFAELTQVMGNLYIAEYERLKQELKDAAYDKYVSDGGKATKTSFMSSYEISKQDAQNIREELRDIEAAIPTAMHSAEDTAQAKLSLLTSDSYMASSSVANPYRIQTTDGYIGGEVNEISSRMKGSGAISTHALDASIALITQAMNAAYTATLNVHDANAAGIGLAHTITGSYNETFYKKAIQEYSYVAEALKQYEHIISKLNPETIEYESGDETITVATTEFTKEMQSLNEAIQLGRKTLADNLYSVDQYTTSPYVVGSIPDAAQVVENVRAAPARTVQDILDVTPTTTTQVFEMLGTEVSNDSVEHKNYLRSVMGSLVGNGLADIQVTISKAVGQPYHTINSTDMVINNLRAGKNRYARKRTGAVRMSAQEFYVNELAYAVGGYWVDNNSLVRDELKNMYSLAKKAALANPELWAKHEDLFNEVFAPKTVDGVSSYLQTFFSSAVSNQGMRELSATVEIPSGKSEWFKGDTFLDKVASFLNTMMNKLRGKVVNATSLNADKRMSELLRHITTLDSNHRTLAMRMDAKVRQHLDGKFNFFNKELAELLTKPAEMYSAASNRAIKGILSPMKLTHDLLTHGDDLIATRVIKDWGRRAVYSLVENNNVLVRELGALILSAKGRDKRNSKLVDVLHATKQSADRGRMQILPQVAQTLMKSFDPSVELSPETKTALTYILAKTDLPAILDIGNSVGDALDLVTNDVARSREISRLTKELNGLVGNDWFYALQAKNLGWLMVDGKGQGLRLPRYNAYAIAQGQSGTDKVNPKVEKLVDQLATLHALNYSKPSMRSEAGNVIRHEMSRKDAEGNAIVDNGILNTLYTLKAAKDNARTNLFKGSENLMQKGYIGDKFPSRMEMAFSTDSADESLLARGYTLYGEIGTDPSTGHQGKRYMYTSPYGGLAKFETGAFVLDAKHSRGTDIEPPAGVSKFTMNARMTATKVAEDQAVYRRGTLNIQPGTQLAQPKWDTNGNIIGYRLTMTEQTKDSLMQRDTDLFNVVAELSASSHIKNIAPELNNDVLKALKAIHDEWGEDYPHDFVWIGPRSKRKEDQAYWNTLPYETRVEAAKMFGRDAIPVRRDSRAIVFGTRNWAVTDIWDKPEQDRRLIEKVVYSVATMFFGNTAAIKLSKGEDLLKTLARIAKDNIVIKGFITTVGNTMSNILLNISHGINPLVQLTQGAEAYAHAVRYLKGQRRLIELDTLSTNPHLPKALLNKYDAERAIIKEDMRVSPVKGLIDSGALQNIEEITREDESSIYDGVPLAETIGNAYRGVVTKDSWVDSLVKNTLILQGSALYNQLRIAAQLSDFTAKYSYVKSRTERTKNPMSMENAIREANDLFIDYQLPDGVIMQTMNDLGLFYFTKYLIRVQKTILSTIAKAPIRSLMVILGADWLNMAPSIFGSFMDNPLHRLGNPVSMFVGSLDEPLILGNII